MMQQPDSAQTFTKIYLSPLNMNSSVWPSLVIDLFADFAAFLSGLFGYNLFCFIERVKDFNRKGR